jgi:hypothetical protein
MALKCEMRNTLSWVTSKRLTVYYLFPTLLLPLPPSRKYEHLFQQPAHAHYQSIAFSQCDSPTFILNTRT